MQIFLINISISEKVSNLHSSREESQLIQVRSTSLRVTLCQRYSAVITFLQMIRHHCQYTSLWFTFQLGCRPCDFVWTIKNSETLQKQQMSVYSVRKKKITQVRFCCVELRWYMTKNTRYILVTCYTSLPSMVYFFWYILNIMHCLYNST